MKTISIIRNESELKGTLHITHGEISGLERDDCTGDVDQEGRSFALAADGECRLKVTIDGHSLEPGAFATIVSLITIDDGFSFFLRDVSREHPVYVAEYKTIVTDGDDSRRFDAIAQEIELPEPALETRRVCTCRGGIVR